MVWRRLFKGRSTTTAVDESETPEETTAPEAVAEMPAPEPPPPSEPIAPPRFGGFSFEAPDPSPRAETLKAPAPDISPGPTAQVAAAVRRKTSRRGGRVADRGVGPVLVPSLREQALLYRMAAEERGAHQPDVALGLWQAYLALCPEDGESWFLYGQCLLTQGLDDAAWGAFVETRRRLPTHGLSAGALGYLSAARGDFDEAIRHYRDAAHHRPGCLDMLRGLADAQGRAGRAADAKATLSRIQQITDAG